MLLEAKLKPGGIIEVEYNEQGQDALLKAGILSGIWKAIDSDHIGELEQEIKRLKKVNRKLRKKLRNED